MYDVCRCFFICFTFAYLHMCGRRKSKDGIGKENVLRKRLHYDLVAPKVIQPAATPSATGYQGLTVARHRVNKEIR